MVSISWKTVFKTCMYGYLHTRYIHYNVKRVPTVIFIYCSNILLSPLPEVTLLSSLLDYPQIYCFIRFLYHQPCSYLKTSASICFAPLALTVQKREKLGSMKNCFHLLRFGTRTIFLQLKYTRFRFASTKYIACYFHAHQLKKKKRKAKPNTTKQG